MDYLFVGYGFFKAVCILSFKLVILNRITVYLPLRRLKQKRIAIINVMSMKMTPDIIPDKTAALASEERGKE